MNTQQDSDSDTISETGSLSPIEKYDTNENMDNEQDTEHVNNVRKAVQTWKLREMDNNTSETSSPKGLQNLRNFVAKSATLFYDLNTYMNTSKNKENNMKDALYRHIVDAIGIPATLNNHVKIMLQHILQRDLVELPFTVEPKVINTYAEKGLETPREFPDEQ